MSTDRKPRVFVGSSDESLEYAEAMQLNLERSGTAAVTVWAQGVTDLSASLIDALLGSVSRSDFGVFVLGADDVAVIRGEPHFVARDNVILEIGLFIGALGLERTYIVRPEGVPELRLPTDLLGVTTATFDPSRRDIPAALGSASYQIKRAMKRLGRRDGSAPGASGLPHEPLGRGSPRSSCQPAPPRSAGGVVSEPAKRPGAPNAMAAHKMAPSSGVASPLNSPTANCLHGLEMVLVPAARFVMGRRGQQGIPVRLTKDYWISRHLVRQSLYESVVGTNPSRFRGNDLPVDSVTWEDAVTFCNALSERTGLEPIYDVGSSEIVARFDRDGYRLPTEAEWEHACLGDGSSVHDLPLVEVAWFDRNSKGRSHAVGEKLPNGRGIFDMLGNLWEWCADWFQQIRTHDELQDPTGPASGVERVVRGGSWASHEDAVSPTYRSRRAPSSREDEQGLRIVRTCPHEPSGVPSPAPSGPRKRPTPV